MPHINDVTAPEYIDITTNVENESKKFSTEMDADMATLLKGLDSKNITVSQWNTAISQLGYTAADVRRVYGALKQIATDLDSNIDDVHDYVDAVKAAIETAFETTIKDTEENRKLIEKNAARINDLYSPDTVADLVITTEEEFDQCLYPLYKNEDSLTCAEAALKVSDNSAFNEPDENFTAKRVLVKGVTFTKMRGYDDIRLHIFQPSIEYIKFDGCRWETHWKVSGKNPRDLSAANYNLNTAPERATAFNRATGHLHLTIDGVHLTEKNVIDAPANPITWGVGFRNVKRLVNCHIDYPKTYRLTPEGYRTLELSCQFFDFADACSISGLWDGTNVSNCKVNKILKRCANIANVEAVNLLNHSGATVSISVESCNNMVNLKGLLNFSSCASIAATREEAQGYADVAEENAKNDAKKYLPKHTRSDKDLTYGGIRLYGVDAKNAQVTPHARTGYGANEIVIRDNDGRLHARYSESSDDVDTFYGSWHKQTLMPKDYIDKKLTKRLIGYAPLDDNSKVPDDYLPSYTPLVNGKVPADNLPSYVDDVVEGYYFEEDGEQYFGSSKGIIDSAYTPSVGKIYVDIDTNKTYRWGGSKYVEISPSIALGETSSTAYAGNKGKALADKINTIDTNFNERAANAARGQIDELVREELENVGTGTFNRAGVVYVLGSSGEDPDNPSPEVLNAYAVDELFRQLDAAEIEYVRSTIKDPTFYVFETRYDSLSDLLNADITLVLKYRGSEFEPSPVSITNLHISLSTNLYQELTRIHNTNNYIAVYGGTVRFFDNVFHECYLVVACSSYEDAYGRRCCKYEFELDEFSNGYARHFTFADEGYYDATLYIKHRKNY